MYERMMLTKIRVRFQISRMEPHTMCLLLWALLILIVWRQSTNVHMVQISDNSVIGRKF